MSAYLVTLGAAGWLAAASAGYAFVRYQRGVETAELSDFILLPLRWKHYQETRGQFYITSAQRQLSEKAFREAFHNLRIGVAKAPQHRDGRLLLAEFYVAWKRNDLALSTLQEGLRFHQNDPIFLRTLFTYLLQQQRDDQVIEIGQSLLSNGTTSAEASQLASLAAASAAFFRGRFDLAEDLLHSKDLANSREGRLLEAKIDWECGYRDLALYRLRNLRTDLPNDAETYVQLVTYLREAGRDAEARQESLIRQLAEPNDARARIELLHALHRSGDFKRRDAEAAALLVNFAQQPEALLALSDFAANAGLPDLANRIYDHCKSANIAWEGPALMTIEANIVAERYQAALDRARQLLAENPDWAKRYYSVFNGLQAIALHGLGDAEAASLYLTNFLGQTNVRADNLVAVSNRLLRVNAKSQARQVLAQAVAAEPLNQPALASLIKLDLESGNATAAASNLDQFLAMRRPSTEILRLAYRQLGSDRYLFTPNRTPLLNRLKTAINSSETARQRTSS